MRAVVPVVVSLLLGCQREPTNIHADEPPRTADAQATEVGDAADVADVTDAAGDVIEASPIPARTATRTRFVTHVLTVADHGIDGTFELWRDSRLDDKRVDDFWYGFVFEQHDPPAGFETVAPASAQLVLRDARRSIVESLDLERPLARMTPVRLGDDDVPYLEIAIDTYIGAGRWGGTTHRFVRVDAGRSRWLGCAETYQCALGCRFRYDRRPSGGVDILEWRHGWTADVLTPITDFTRIEVGAGACSRDTRTVKSWVGDWGSGTMIRIPADFPARR